MKILIFLLIIQQVVCRQKTNLDWQEPPDIQVHAAEESLKQESLMPKGKNKTISIKSTNTTLVELGQFPHYALLMMNKKDEWHPFGAAIIHKHKILTVASILHDHDRGRAFAGLIDRTDVVIAEYSSGEFYKESWIIHPGYKEGSIKDNIAIITVCFPIELSINVNPCKMPPNDEDLTGKLGSLAGFGDIKGSGRRSSFMHYYKVPVLSHEVCSQKIGHDYDPKAHFCVKPRHGANGCWGDLGGGMMIEINGQDYLWGLYVQTSKTCEPGTPTIFMNVEKYANWINEHLQSEHHESSKITHIGTTKERPVEQPPVESEENQSEPEEPSAEAQSEQQSAEEEVEAENEEGQEAGEIEQSREQSETDTSDMVQEGPEVEENQSQDEAASDEHESQQVNEEIEAEQVEEETNNETPEEPPAEESSEEEFEKNLKGKKKTKGKGKGKGRTDEGLQHRVEERDKVDIAELSDEDEGTEEGRRVKNTIERRLMTDDRKRRRRRRM